MEELISKFSEKEKILLSFLDIDKEITNLEEFMLDKNKNNKNSKNKTTKSIDGIVENLLKNRRIMRGIIYEDNDNNEFVVRIIGHKKPVVSYLLMEDGGNKLHFFDRNTETGEIKKIISSSE